MPCGEHAPRRVLRDKKCTMRRDRDRLCYRPRFKLDGRPRHTLTRVVETTCRGTAEPLAGLIEQGGDVGSVGRVAAQCAANQFFAVGPQLLGSPGRP